MFDRKAGGIIDLGKIVKFAAFKNDLHRGHRTASHAGCFNNINDSLDIPGEKSLVRQNQINLVRTLGNGVCCFVAHALRIGATVREIDNSSSFNTALAQRPPCGFDKWGIHTNSGGIPCRALSAVTQYFDLFDRVIVIQAGQIKNGNGQSRGFRIASCCCFGRCNDF